MEHNAILQLDRLSEYREDNQIEAKAAQGGLPDSLWESYSAFANTDGGCILLGVKERQDHSLQVIGLKDADKLVRDFWNMVNNRQKISVNLMTERRIRIEKVEGRDLIVIEVPRAERTSRPVYKELDPRTGTFRRNGEGDYLCSLEEVSAMFRDASLNSQDAKVLREFGMSAFCQDSIRDYRQVFQNIHPNHTWNRLEDEVFLRRIGATAMGDDGVYHPTAAGLLMFGYEYEITREFPQYFLDYQENRQMATTRWTDRIVSSSGDWSGNVFDFVGKVVPKLTTGLKVPFVLKGMQRVDDTPVHKILREAVTNACSNADFYGRRGLVISKRQNGYTFANPGSMRVAKKEAIEGGVSDPRNGVMLKMFSLVNYGERAGSGLNSIFNVWNHVYHTPAKIQEDAGIDRVSVVLSNGGHEQDVKAMLELYDNPEELVFPDAEELTDIQKSSQEIGWPKLTKRQNRIVDIIRDEQINGKTNRNEQINEQINGKTDKNEQINEQINSVRIARILGVSNATVRREFEFLRDLGVIKRVGSKKTGHWELVEWEEDGSV